jgi:meso-butanediol dehydrogenase / (S,S)-butanediol dehydrogenase / diacetyl reductase
LIGAAPSLPTDHVSVVTGGGSGIGRAICRALASAGGAVAVLDISSERAEVVAAGLPSTRAHTAIAADVSEPGNVVAAVETVVSRMGRIDLLINNAGSASTARFLEQSFEAWKHDFGVNVDGPFLMTQAVAPVMMRQEISANSRCRGKIINVSSPAAELGRPLLAAYGASKAALNHLSKTTAVVLGEFAIATTTLYPGAVADGMWDRLPAELGALQHRSADEVLQEHVEDSLLRRFQSAEEVAEMALVIATQIGLGLNGKVVWSFAHPLPL